MKIIYNNFIPVKGFVACNICGIIFARKGYRPLSEDNVRHEAIHTAQMKELLYVGFYVAYMLEWLIRLPFGRAYRRISFEREAYRNSSDRQYLARRRGYAMWRM